MKNGNQDFLGTDTDGYEDIQLMRLIPLPDGMTVMCVDTDDEDNVVMRDCVDTPNCYCLAEAEEEGKVLASVNGENPEWCEMTEQPRENGDEMESGFLFGSFFVPFSGVMRV